MRILCGNSLKALLVLAGLVMFGGTRPATAVDAPAAPEASEKKAVLIPGVVARAQFTHAIKDLEPVDAVSVLGSDQNRIVYFTEIHGMAGQTIVHRWEFNGQIIMEVPIKVGTSRWRAYSTKTLFPSLTGDWKVSVVDSEGGTLSVNTFTYLKKPEAPTAVATTPAP